MPVRTHSDGWAPELLTWLVAFIAGGAVVAAAWRWGMGVALDTITYMDAAEEIAKGGGFVPDTQGSLLLSPHYPPLYSIVLAAFYFVSDNLPRSTTWLHAALLAANVVLIARLTARAGTTAYAPLAAAALLASNNPFLEAHGWMASEGLFLFCLLAALLLLGAALPLEARARRHALLWAALATAAACLTRYAGLSLLGAGAVAILFWAHGSRRQRLIDAVTFALIAGAPIGLWLLRNHLVFETAVNRTVALLGLPPEQVERLRLTILHWFLPWPVERGPLLVAAAVALVGACVAAWRPFAFAPSNTLPAPPTAASHGRSSVSIMRRLLLTFAASYAVLAFATVLFLDRTTLLDTRLFLPLQIVLLVLAVAVVGEFVARAPGRSARSAVIAVLLLLITLNASASLDRIVLIARGGRGFTSRAWTNSQTLKEAAALPASTRLYTNSHEAIRLHLGRRSTLLPRAYEWSPTKPANTYEQTLAELSRRLRWQDAAVVWFNRSHRTPRSEPEADLMRKLGLVRIVRKRDGAIYVPAGSPTTSPTTSPITAITPTTTSGQ